MNPAQMALLGILLCIYFVLGALFGYSDDPGSATEIFTKIFPFIALLIAAGLMLSGLASLIIDHF